MPSCETCKCNFCGRRAIVVDQRTGNRVPHRVRAGRKGPQCAGSNRHRDSVPEQAKGSASRPALVFNRLQVFNRDTSSWHDIEGIGPIRTTSDGEARR